MLIFLWVTRANRPAQKKGKTMKTVKKKYSILIPCSPEIAARVDALRKSRGGLSRASIGRLALTEFLAREAPVKAAE